MSWARLGPGARTEGTSSGDRGQRLELTNITRHQEGLYRSVHNGHMQSVINLVIDARLISVWVKRLWTRLKLASPVSDMLRLP